MTLVAALTSFSASTRIKSAEVNSNFTAIRDVVNGSVVHEDVATTITVTHTWSASQTFSGGITGTTAVMSGTIRTTATGGFTLGVQAGQARIVYGVSEATTFDLVNGTDGSASLVALNVSLASSGVLKLGHNRTAAANAANFSAAGFMSLKDATGTEYFFPVMAASW